MKQLILCLAITCVALPAAAQNEINAVELGKELFLGKGCVECHAIEKNDLSMKTGPNLYGLFLSNAREREVGPEGRRSMVKADKAYFVKSIRNAWDELAVAEAGDNKGETYAQVMPPYTKKVISDHELEALWHYVRTLADKDQAGPAKVMIKADANAQSARDPNAHEILVTDRVRVFRLLADGLSARAIHVGLTNGMNYSFDPRLLTVRRVWSGGFLNMENELQRRGTRPVELGRQASVHVDTKPLLAPLTRSGQPVDFEFKEPDIHDREAMAENLWHETDYLDRLAALDAEFLGYHLDSQTGMPSFQMRVGKNRFQQTVNLSDGGLIHVTLQGRFAEPQHFQLANEFLLEPTVEGGTLKKGLWKLPATKGEKTYQFRAKIPKAVANKLEHGSEENWKPQALVETETIVKKPKRRKRDPVTYAITTKPGYSAFTWQSPKDLHGRTQIFEAVGIAVAKDGTIVLGTRAAGVWRIRDGKWSLFAEGTWEVMGVCIEDDKGDQIVIAHKPELTRLKDTDGDGRADVFETVCDDFGFSGNYHEYVHGPVRDSEGNYYFNLNLAHAGGEGIFNAGGKFMGSTGGYRGWACRVTPGGKFEPFASGLRSPASLGISPDGRLWYADNQGEYVGTSRWVALEKGDFYGHPSSLVNLPGITSEQQIDIEEWLKKTHKGAVMLPHGKIANAPGHPEWDTTGGKFGPYDGQCFIGDQTLSNVFRVVTETVDGVDQGCAIIFARGLRSGVMRPCFLPDGSLLLGQTGRGWHASGGNEDALQRIAWDGKTIPGDLLKVSCTSKGFDLHFTAPFAEDAKMPGIRISSFTYMDSKEYGSSKRDRARHRPSKMELSENRKVLHLTLEDFGEDDTWLDKVYHIEISDTADKLEGVQTEETLDAYYTLRAIPK